MTNFELATLIISIISLIISLIVAYITLVIQRFNLTIKQDHEGHQSGVLLSYDGVRASVKEMTGKPNYSQIILLRVVIINKSSLPISIISFHLENDSGPEFCDYSHTDPYYVITQEYGTVNFGFPDDPLDYLKPIINLQPYETTAGYLSFPTSDLFNIDYNNPIKLIVKTSRGKKLKKLKLGPIYQSVPDAIYKSAESINYN